MIKTDTIEDMDMGSISGQSFAQTDKWIRRGMYLLCVGAVLVNIKSIFTDFDADSEYALVTSYRMLIGDHMFAEMWEPHQTSAFLTTFFMWLYKTVTGTFTGVVIYLHSLGALLQGIIAIAVYKVLSRRSNLIGASFAAIFFLTFRPKRILFLEFSNMQMMFSVLLFLCLLFYFDGRKKKKWLLAASLCLCLQILSYPSCLLVYGVVIIIVVIYSDRKLSDILLFSLACFLQGTGYILFFAGKLGMGKLLSGVANIVSADGTHGNFLLGSMRFYSFFLQSYLRLAACMLTALLLEVIFWAVSRKRRAWNRANAKSDVLLLFSALFFLVDVIRLFTHRDNHTYIAAFLLILLLGIKGFRYCSAEEKKIYTMGMLLSSGSFVSTILLTNLDLLSVIAYLVLGIMVSFFPLVKWLEHHVTHPKELVRLSVPFLFCAVVVLQRGFIVRAMNGLDVNLFDLRGMVKTGPAAGIVTDYMGAYEVACNVEDWGNFVRPGDSLLIVGGEKVNYMSYMYEDVTVSIPSTICSPSYNERFLRYWGEYPEKFPTVIAVSCWYGDLRISEDSWIYRWIQDEFRPSTYADGRYWRFYRLEGTG